MASVPLRTRAKSPPRQLVYDREFFIYPGGIPKHHVNRQNHVDEDRRGAGAGHLRAAADREGIRQGHRGGDRPARHLAGRAHHRSVSGTPARRPAHSRRAGRPRRAGEDARRQHRQAAQHQRFGAAVAGSHRRAAEPRLRRSRLPRRTGRRRRAGDQGALRRRARIGRQSGAARGQLGPASGHLGEAVRPRSIRTG